MPRKYVVIPTFRREDPFQGNSEAWRGIPNSASVRYFVNNVFYVLKRGLKIYIYAQQDRHILRRVDGVLNNSIERRLP